MLSLIETLKDMLGFIGALKEYFVLKNNELWSGTFVSGSITVPNISKYQTLEIWTALGYHVGFLYRRGETFRGAAVIGYPAWFATQSFEMSLNGDRVTMTANVMLTHNQNGAHDTMNTKTYGISKIIGIDPIVPDTLKKYIGGGYLKSLLSGGGVYAAIKTFTKKHYGRYNISKCESKYIPTQNILKGKFKRGIYNPWVYNLVERKIFITWKYSCKCRYGCEFTYNYPIIRHYRRKRISEGQGNWLRRRRLFCLGVSRCGDIKNSVIANIWLLFRQLYIYRKNLCYKAHLIYWGCCNG